MVKRACQIVGTAAELTVTWTALSYWDILETYSLTLLWYARLIHKPTPSRLCYDIYENHSLISAFLITFTRPFHSRFHNDSLTHPLTRAMHTPTLTIPAHSLVHSPLTMTATSLMTRPLTPAALHSFTFLRTEQEQRKKNIPRSKYRFSSCLTS